MHRFGMISAVSTLSTVHVCKIWVVLQCILEKEKRKREIRFLTRKCSNASSLHTLGRVYTWYWTNLNVWSRCVNQFQTSKKMVTMRGFMTRHTKHWIPSIYGPSPLPTYVLYLITFHLLSAFWDIWTSCQRNCWQKTLWHFTILFYTQCIALYQTKTLSNSILQLKKKLAQSYNKSTDLLPLNCTNN